METQTVLEPPQQRENCPWPGKQAFATKAEADAACAAFRRRRNTYDQHAYLCECGSWHYGRSREEFKKRLNRAFNTESPAAKRKRQQRKRGRRH